MALGQDCAVIIAADCHTFFPYWEGISKPHKWQPEPKPVQIDGKTYTYYQATQRQRALERQIRAVKRFNYAGGEIPASKIKSLTEAYNAFSDKAGIKPRPELLRVLEKKR